MFVFVLIWLRIEETYTQNRIILILGKFDEERHQNALQKAQQTEYRRSSTQITYVVNKFKDIVEKHWDNSLRGREVVCVQALYLSTNRFTFFLTLFANLFLFVFCFLYHTIEY